MAAVLSATTPCLTPSVLACAGQRPWNHTQFASQSRLIASLSLPLKVCDYALPLKVCDYALPLKVREYAMPLCVRVE